MSSWTGGTARERATFGCARATAISTSFVITERRKKNSGLWSHFAGSLIHRSYENRRQVAVLQKKSAVLNSQRCEDRMDQKRRARTDVGAACRVLAMKVSTKDCATCLGFILITTRARLWLPRSSSRCGPFYPATSAIPRAPTGRAGRRAKLSRPRGARLLR